MKFRFSDYQTLIDPTGIDSLKTIRAKDFSLQIGSAVTVSELQQYLAEFIPTLPGRRSCKSERKKNLARSVLQKRRHESFVRSKPCCTGLAESISETRL